MVPSAYMQNDSVRAAQINAYIARRSTPQCTPCSNSVSTDSKLDVHEVRTRKTINSMIRWIVQRKEADEMERLMIAKDEGDEGTTSVSRWWLRGGIGVLGCTKSDDFRWSIYQTIHRRISLLKWYQLSSSTSFTHSKTWTLCNLWMSNSQFANQNCQPTKILRLPFIVTGSIWWYYLSW